jgi:hypothetical protein
MPDDCLRAGEPGFIEGAVALVDLVAADFEGRGKEPVVNAPSVSEEDDAGDALVGGERVIDGLQNL